MINNNYGNWQNVMLRYLDFSSHIGWFAATKAGNHNKSNHKQQESDATRVTPGTYTPCHVDDVCGCLREIGGVSYEI